MVSSQHESVVLAKCRNCVCVWDTSTGKIRNKIAESMLGSVVSLARLTKDGQHLVLVESGNVCIWNLTSLSMVFKENFDNEIVDIVMQDKEKRCFIVSKLEENQKHYLHVSSRALPSGKTNFAFQFPVWRIKPICITFEGAYLVTVAWEKKVSLSIILQIDLMSFITGSVIRLSHRNRGAMP